MATTLTGIFNKTVSAFAARPALMTKRNGRYRSVNYAQFDAWVQELAAYLLEAGVGVGERVAILGENRLEWVVTDQAVLALGAVTVPIYPTLTATQIAGLLNDCGACCVLVSNLTQLDKVLSVADQVSSLRFVLACDGEDVVSSDKVRVWSQVMARGAELLPTHCAAIAARSEALRPDDLASIVYTSGTTGEPRGAMLTHRNFASNALTVADVAGVDQHDLELSFLPLSHVLERVVYYALVARGAAIAFAESIESLPQNLVEVSPTVLVSVPRVLEKIHERSIAKIEAAPPLQRELFWAALEVGEFYHKVMNEDGRVVFPTNVLYKAAYKLVFKPLRDSLGGKLRFVVSGGAPLAPEIGIFFQAAGIPVLEGYGLTETSPVLALNPIERPKFGTVGPAIPGVELKLAADGEILARGPNVMRGYWNQEEATREVLDPDGWFHTGDIGRLDDEGYLAIVDRKKELLVMSNGKNVAPQPIENRLKMHALIEQVMVIGDQHPYLTALIVPNPAACEKVARDAGLSWETPGELYGCEPVREAIAGFIAKENERLAPYERIKRWAIVARPFSTETSEMTATLKLRRKVIVDKYRELIAAMYQASNEKVLVHS